MSYSFAGTGLLAFGALLLCVSLGACGEKDEDGEDNTSGGCGFPESGTDGEANVSPGSSETLDKLDEMAQNTSDFEYHSQLPWHRNGVLAGSTCGDFGLLAWTYGDPDMQRTFFSLPGGSPEQVSVAVMRNDGMLFYDADCDARVLAVSSPPSLVEFHRTGAGSWEQGQLHELSSLLGEEPAYVGIVDTDEGADGNLYVFATASISAGEVLIRGRRGNAPSDNWVFQVIPTPTASQLFVYRVGPDGATHALYRNTEYPCDPCNVDFLHGTLADVGGTWEEEVVQEGVWGDPNDQFIESADMDFTDDGTFYIAAHFAERAITGSYQAAQLRIYGLVDGDWCNESVAAQSDGYQGGDGTGYTGADPRISIDDVGRIHVVYRDQALWHDGQGYQNEIRGQVRYAVRSGNTWTNATLFSQSGQSEYSSPLAGFGPPLLAIFGNGETVVTGGILFTWETDSIYNDTAVPVTYDVVGITSSVSFP